MEETTLLPETVLCLGQRIDKDAEHVLQLRCKNVLKEIKKERKKILLAIQRQYMQFDDSQGAISLPNADMPEDTPTHETLVTLQRCLDSLVAINSELKTILRSSPTATVQDGASPQRDAKKDRRQKKNIAELQNALRSYRATVSRWQSEQSTSEEANLLKKIIDKEEKIEHKVQEFSPRDQFCTSTIDAAEQVVERYELSKQNLSKPNGVMQTEKLLLDIAAHIQNRIKEVLQNASYREPKDDHKERATEQKIEYLLEILYQSVQSIVNDEYKHLQKAIQQCGRPKSKYTETDKATIQQCYSVFIDMVESAASDPLGLRDLIIMFSKQQVLNADFMAQFLTTTNTRAEDFRKEAEDIDHLVSVDLARKKAILLGRAMFIIGVVEEMELWLKAVNCIGEEQVNALLKKRPKKEEWAQAKSKAEESIAGIVDIACPRFDPQNPPIMDAEEAQRFKEDTSIIKGLTINFIFKERLNRATKRNGDL